jgi:small subunit ribosomal protein S15
MALQKEEKVNLIKEFARTEGDSGSVEVQVAVLSKNIDQLTNHCQKNPKDFSSRRGLLKMVCKRRSLLSYLKDTATERYQDLIGKLGLRK